MRIGLVGVGRIGAFHARTLAEVDGVDEIVLADADAERAQVVAKELDLESVPDVDQLVASAPDGLVIASPTQTHATLLRAGVAAGIPVFCEKPVAGTLEDTIALARELQDSEVPVHIGFQRRFDTGYRRIRDAVQSGELGWLHSIRANTHDQDPPPPGYIQTSGGIFRDCNVHDFDILRFVTGREVVSAYATGANKGEPFFTEYGDVDTGAAILTLDDDTLVFVSSTRYNGGGHDVRFEAMGDKGAMAVGLDSTYPLQSAEEGVEFPGGPQVWSFMERFLPAYQAELTAFTRVAKGEIPSPCSVSDALQAFRVAEACELSKQQGRPVRLDEVDDL
ncbi:MAG TPA: Gfo/Idh/MocA family oxidoreductase [Segeticoccus sp.]|nr:Gfo/Idh/MocA family oxidoreductase [Segeticoccus sp.]